MPDTSFVRFIQSFKNVIYSCGNYTGCLLICFILLISCRTGREIREYNANVMPAYNALERLIGPRANEFVLRLTSHATDQVTISTARGEVIIEGSSIPAICYGAYTYLRKVGAVHISWEGNRVSLPAQWPDQPLQTLQSPFVYRQYLNVCAFGYTTVWWDWERWENEIDWMAIRGINMPSSMEGQEAVYLRLWKEMGLTDADILAHFSGAAFLPWHRMGNINGYGGPLPLSYIKKKEVLQKQILERMRSLGMHPVVPAFSGYVPAKLKDKFQSAQIRQLEPWEKGFEGTYMLDPKDPLFLTIGKRFIEIYQEMYGDASFYLADSFNEMKPPVTAANKQSLLAEYGEAVYKSIQQGDSSATWVMQGWLFGNDSVFWDTTAIQSFLSKVPPSKMIIQDFGNDRYPDIWKRTKAYGGKQWTYGYVHNYGGSNPVYGDFEFYNEEVTGLLNNLDKRNLVGYGVLPEGLHNNSVIYEYIYDLSWSAEGIVWEDWIKQYSQDRYGYASEDIVTSWNLLKESVFQTRYWTPRWWKGGGAYLLFKRPTAAIVEFTGYPSDKLKLRNALQLMLKEAEKNKANPLLAHDLVEFTRHYMSMHIDSLLIDATKAYTSGNMAQGDALADKTFLLAAKLDTLIAVQHLNVLGSWLEDASRYGDNAQESELYIQNARTQITIWGGDNLKDYASKSWQGMYKEFYVPRWKMFFDEMKKARAAGRKFDEDAVRLQILKWEENWDKQKDIPAHIKVEDATARVAELMQF